MTDAAAVTLLFLSMEPIVKTEWTDDDGGGVRDVDDVGEGLKRAVGSEKILSGGGATIGAKKSDVARGTAFVEKKLPSVWREEEEENESAVVVVIDGLGTNMAAAGVKSFLSEATEYAGMEDAPKKDAPTEDAATNDAATGDSATRSKTLDAAVKTQSVLEF